MQRLGMIAGAGELPGIIAQRTYHDGQSLPTIALSAEVAAQLAPYCPALVHCAPGQLSKIIRMFQQHAVQQIVIVGKVPKRSVFDTLRLDLRAIRVLSRLRDYRDVTLLQALIEEFARAGLEVVEQTRLLGHLVTPGGVLSSRQPTTEQWEDIAYGFRHAKHLAALDIGQTLVIRRQTVLAVEAVEGTDAAIERGGALGKAAVVVKVSRPQQDMRFDVPTVGPATLQALIAGGASVLAVEADTTLMIRASELAATADAHRIAVVGVSEALLQERGMDRSA